MGRVWPWVMVDLSANHIPQVFSDGCHTLRQGRLHLSSDDRSRLGLM